MDPDQSYCHRQKNCMSNFTLCSKNAAKSCDSDKTFSFSGERCSAQNMSCCENKTLGYVNFDYEKISGLMIYATNGLKRFLIESKSQRPELQPGDVFGVRFPASGPAAALKTSLAGSSLHYSSSVVNRTNSSILRGNRLPKTEDSPTQVLHVPAIAVVYSTYSESKLENVYDTDGHKNVLLSFGNSKTRMNYTKSICLQETITELQLHLPEVFPSAETVNVTGSIKQGSNVTYIWDFGDKSNATSVTPWITHVYASTGEKRVHVLAGNNIGLMALWCSIVVQERISGLKFKNDSLMAIENGTTARIGWMLFNGSHLDFNITITYPDGSIQATNLTDPKAPAARFFAMYKKNLTLPGWYNIRITATNKVNSETIMGNLSVQFAVHGVAMDYPKILKTNQTFNFTILPHQGEEMARYTLKTKDGRIINTTDKIITHTYTKAGRYSVILMAANDISSVVVDCAEINVQDVIEGFQFTSFNHTVAVHAEAEIRWRLTQGSELSIVIDYGDGISKLVNQSVSVSDVFVALSKHNYSQPGVYLVSINTTNLVDSQTINTTVYVETPGQDAGLAIGRGNLTKVVGGPCSGVLYVPVNESVTATASVANGTNMNGLLDFGDESIDRRIYFHRNFPDEGWTANHSYSREGEYNITVTFFNRNPKNISHTCRIIVQYPVSVVIVTSNSPKKSSDSVVMMNVSFPGYAPSGPLSYRWDHGDNTTRFLQNTRMRNHSYPNKCGVYIASVKVYNEISYGIGMVEVVIQDEIKGLTLIANHTDLNVDRDHCPSFKPERNVFPVEFAVEFNASITSGTNVTFNWTFPDDESSCVGMSCRHNFSNAGDKTVKITAVNDVSTVEYKLEKILLLESILGVELTNNGPSVQKKAVNFTLKMDQTGRDSCFEIDLNEKPEKKIYYKSGSPTKTNCSQDNQEVARSQKFWHTYNKPDEYHVKLTARNRVSCEVINDDRSKVAVGKGECTFPVITAPGFKEGLENRTEFKRSERINIKTHNKIKCFEFKTAFRWEIYKLCDSDQPVKLTIAEEPRLKEINTTRSELTFPPRFFNYCRALEIRFMINMTEAPGFYSEKTWYLEINKSPLVAIIGGGSERTVGNEEPVKIDASQSHDPDTTGHEGTTLNIDYKFAWFCKRSDDKNYTLPTNLTNLPPIPTPPPQINTTYNSSAGYGPENLGGCFGYGPGQLNFSLTKIELNTTQMTPNTTYEIRFVMAKEERTKFTDQLIRVLPGDPPTLSFE